MTREKRDTRPLTGSFGDAGGSRLEDLAAELTEAAFPVALRRGVGTDWLDRKLELWHAMTRTVHAWEL
jgi:hypothetical protein